MGKRRDHGDGGIDPSGKGTWRIRWRVGGKRYSEVFRGSKSGAQAKLRERLHAGDIGQHVAPDRVTLRGWLPRWVALIERKAEGEGGARRRGRLINTRTLERYEDLLRLHVLPTLGDVPLQKLTGSSIDNLYIGLEEKLAPRTCHHVHTVLKNCLKVAMKKRLVASNPAADAEAPSPGEADHGMVLDEEQLLTLVSGFKDHSLFPIVAVAAFTGARRNEILALKWTDISFEKGTLSISRAVEQTRRYGRSIKQPKTDRGVRTIAIDHSLLDLLRLERDKHRRLIAGVPDSADVDLALVKLPDHALIFPGGDGTDLTKLRDVDAVTRGFSRIAKKLGFARLRLHDLRGSHETILLDKGTPVHVVAARCGHDPAVLLKFYAKRTKKADTRAAEVIGSLSKSVLGSNLGPKG
jgi:integrase